MRLLIGCILRTINKNSEGGRALACQGSRDPATLGRERRGAATVSWDRLGGLPSGASKGKEDPDRTMTSDFRLLELRKNNELHRFEPPSF